MAPIGGIFIKLGSLAVRTLAKPVSKTFVQQSKAHPRWRAIFVSFGQFHHKIQYKFQARLLGHRVKTVKPLEEEKALELGTDTISELIVFSVAGICLSLEVYRNLRASEQSKLAEEEDERREKQAILDRFSTIEAEVERLRDEQATRWRVLDEAVAELRAVRSASK